MSINNLLNDNDLKKVENYYKDKFEKAEQSGSGGTSDYTDLTNKPSINSVELTGNKTSNDLGIGATTVLYTAEDTTTANTITLNQAYTDFDIISIKTMEDNYAIFNTLSTQLLDTNDNITITSNSNYIAYTITDTTTLTLYGGRSMYIKKIVGIKY